jgi:glycine cleavage system H protein
MGEVESVKAVSDLYSPVSGEVIQVNSALTDRPELTNEDPFGEGWLIRVTMSDTSELDSLLSVEEYDAYLAEQH